MSKRKTSLASGGTGIASPRDVVAVRGGEPVTSASDDQRKFVDNAYSNLDKSITGLEADAGMLGVSSKDVSSGDDFRTITLRTLGSADEPAMDVQHSVRRTADGLQYVGRVSWGNEAFERNLEIRMVGGAIAGSDRYSRRWPGVEGKNVMDVDFLVKPRGTHLADIKVEVTEEFGHKLGGDGSDTKLIVAEGEAKGVISGWPSVKGLILEVSGEGARYAILSGVPRSLVLTGF